MKKWFIYALLGILASSAIFLACQKEETAPIPSNTNIIAFSQQEQDLLDKLKNDFEPVASDRKMKWWQIIGKDLLGGLAGGAVGSGIPAIGTTAGFIIGAVGSSLVAMEGMVEPPQGNGGQSNPENPFDEAGYHHNMGLAANLEAFLALDPSEITNDLLYGYGETYIVDVLRVDFTPYRPLFYAPTSEVFDLARTDSDIPEIIDQMLASGIITPIMAEVSRAYYENVIPLPDDTFYEASVLFEADVLNSDIEEADKNVILGSLAVGRYSRGFWGAE